MNVRILLPVLCEDADKLEPMREIVTDEWSLLLRICIKGIVPQPRFERRCCLAIASLGNKRCST